MSVAAEPPVRFLDIDDVLAAAAAAFGGPPVVRDPGLLQSAVALPRMSVFGEDAYPGLHRQAAVLLVALVRNHALVDGNKRLGWTATGLFYDFNGYDLLADEDDAYDLVIAIADGSVRDVPVIAQRLAGWAVPGPPALPV